MRTDISVTVNGEPWLLTVESNDVLLETLRSKVGVKSPKIGCERGDCGSCTVLLDGHTVRSCLVLSVETDGHEVVTIEGLTDDGLTELQQFFVDLNSFQCGFCAPGIVLAAAELAGGETPHRPAPMFRRRSAGTCAGAPDTTRSSMQSWRPLKAQGGERHDHTQALRGAKHP